MNDCPIALDEAVTELLSGARRPPNWMTSIRLADVSGVSVRLRHACGVHSVYDFLMLGLEGRARLANYGKKTEAEFQETVRGLIERNEDLGVAETTGEVSRDEQRRKLTVPTFDVLSATDKCPCRNTIACSLGWLNEMLEECDESIRVAEIASFLDLEWPTSGDVCDLTVGALIRLLPSRIFEDQRSGGLGKKKRRVAMLCLWALAEKRVDLRWGTESNVLDHPRLRRLSARQSAILHRRVLVPYPSTLESLALEFGVTRERIRQEEAKLLLAVGDSSLRPRLETVAASLRGKLCTWCGGRFYILEDEVGEFSGTLTADEQLAVRVCGGGSLKDWLGATFLQVGHGFFLQPRCYWSELARQFGRAGGISCPVSVDDLAISYGIEGRGIEAYFVLMHLGYVFGGFLIPTGDGRAFCRRAVAWHNRLVGSRRLCFNFVDLFRDYTVGNRDARLIKTAIYRATSLFSHTPTAFVCLRDGDRDEDTSEMEERGSNPRATELSQVSDVSGDHEAAAVDRIYRYAEVKWPVDGEKEGFDRYAQSCESSKDDISAGSIAAYFSMDPRLIRLAPGVFAPESYRSGDRVAERIEKAYRMALDDSAIRTFLFGRWTEDDCTSLFPLWDDAYEALIVERLSSRCDEDVLWESCAAVCPPNRFCTPSVDLKLRSRRVTAKFRLRPSWVAARSYVSPSPSEALVLAGWAIDLGQISWLRVNQVLGATQVAEERGLNALILLSALGVLAPIGKWWRPVSIREDAREKYAKLRDIVRSSDLATWCDPRLSDVLVAQTGDQLGVRNETYSGVIAACLGGRE